MDKQAIVERFFSKTAPTYDRVVHRFTLGIDRLWKERILEAIEAIPSPKNVLDLACGTGILTFGIALKFPAAHVTGVDISRGYLAVAREKAGILQVTNVTFSHCRAEDFSSEDRFDAITASYLPKYADIKLLVKRLSVMLLDGGVLIFHDFTYPKSRLLQALFEGYFKMLQPIGGLWYPEWKEVFMELPAVIRNTSWVSETEAALREEGFDQIEVKSLTLQGSAIVSARKRGT